MKTDQKIWLLFGSLIFIGLLILAVEYIRSGWAQPGWWVFGLALLVIGVVGLLLLEIKLEMNSM